MSPFGRIRLIVAGLLAVAVFVPALRDYVGFRHLALYRRARAEARSVESAFPALEARLAKAVASSSRAVFQVETARLFVEMARVANEAGRDEDRDTFCDRAVAAYGRAIAANTIDAAALYETGTAYLLYNFPLMTYQDRAKAYFWQALAAKPADETINLNCPFPLFHLVADARYRRQGIRRRDLPGHARPRPRLRGQARRPLDPSDGAPDGLRAVLAELAPAR